ncbi:MAG: porin [Hyphomicrobiaceae bacterium]|nr:porin [Hyphomicrobiaceae bacterium]
MASAVGILLSLGSAQAADLGGNCCADLEERVADLEATTVRKGNRKVSLTLTGQVDKQIMYMSDDRSSRTIAGVDNINASSRFWFAGSASISSSVKAGFEMMIEWAGSSRSDFINQVTTVNGTWTQSANSSGDGSLAIRTANWWLEDSRLGRVTVGRVNIQGPASIIDISGADVQLIAWSNPTLQGGSLYLASSGGGTYYTNTLANLAPYCYGCSREEGIRYDTASIGGLILGAFWGEQDRFTVQARYANEFNGVQIAAGAGYQHDNNVTTNNLNPSVSGTSRSDIEQQAYALSLKHVATGIFVQANTGKTNWKLLNGATGKNDGTMWQIQAGVARNFFGPGIASFYGEYGHAQGYASGTSASSFGGTTITSDSVDYYGFGMTQKIDAAAMTLYLGWRHFDPKVSADSASVSLSEIDTVIGGARIQF